MKKTIIVIILTIFFLINIGTAAFLFLDVQELKFPQTTIRIDVIEINSDEVILRHNIQIYNPNTFELIIKDFQINATTASGEEVTRLAIEGGSIPGLSNRSYTANDRIAIKGNLSGDLTSKITGIIGVNFLGIIKKTTSLEITVLTSLKDALKKIALPTVIIHAEFGTITRHAIDLTTEIEVSNPNPFTLFIGDITLVITTETATNVGNFTITGAQIPAESHITLHGGGSLLLEAFNAKKLMMNLTAETGATIAGINKMLPFSTSLEIAMPDLNQFIPTEAPLELALKVDLERARGGLKGNMTLEVDNPTKIPLIARDIVVDYYRVKNNKKTFIAEGILGYGELTPGNLTLFQGDILLPYSKLFNLSAKSFLSDMIFAQLRANISFYGVNLSLPIAIGSYIDLQPFRPSR